MSDIKIQHVGAGLGVELPQGVVEGLRIGAGDRVSLEKMGNGSYRLVSKTEFLAEQMTLIVGYMHEEDA